jgi:secreted Zn-dependent insulinase-like peptidase
MTSSDAEKKLKVKILDSLSFSDFADFLQDWLKTGRMLWFAYGNISKAASISIVESVRGIFPLYPVVKEALNGCRCVELPESGH